MYVRCPCGRRLRVRFPPEHETRLIVVRCRWSQHRLRVRLPGPEPKAPEPLRDELDWAGLAELFAALGERR